MLEPLDVFANLCYRDRRHPMFDEIYGEATEEEVGAPRSGCACDNCFSGRDRLALEILRLRAQLAEPATPTDIQEH